MAEDSGHDWLENELYAIGREMVYPSSPNVIARVGVRLRGKPSRGFRMPPLGRPAPLRVGIAVLAMLIVVAGVVLALIPSSRSALAEFFGLRDIKVIQVAETPTRVASTPAPERQPTGAVTLDEARRMVDFTILMPTYPGGLDAPDEIYVQALSAIQSQDVQLILEYKTTPDFDTMQGEDNLFTLYSFQARGIFIKLIPSETNVENLSVKGAKAFWIEGGDHFIKYLDESGTEQIERERVVKGNTLAWEQGDVTYRLETSLPLEEALKIAESLD